MLFLMIANVLLSFASYYKKLLSISGALGAALLGWGIIWGTGVLGYLLMGGFFVTSSLLTKFSVYKNKTLMLEELHEKMDVRDLTQVLSNGFMPLVFAILYGLLKEPALLFAYVTALSVASADTWASEIGVFSRKIPKTLIGRKPIRAGLSGGVTSLGLFASFLGAGFIAAFYGFLSCISTYMTYSFSAVFNVSFLLTLLINLVLLTALGFLGALLDSLLGELFQAKYKTKDPLGVTTEKVFTVNVDSKTREENELVSGFAWLNNNRVNLLSVAIVSVLGFFISLLLL